jgi:membrane protein YqaA with SNARE-associated domain
VTDYLLLFLIVFGIHLMPAFTPPTWPIIVLYSLNSALPMPMIVVTAAAAAALGRYLLARASRHIAHRLPQRIQRNLEVAREALERRRGNRLLELGVFALSPVPSAQLFEAAGIARLRLLPLTLAFFVGRAGFYSAYAITARQVRETSLGEALGEGFTNPFALAVQLVVIVLLILLIRLDWAKLLRRG